MFWTGLVIGLVVGANVSLILYACIIAGKRADENEWLYNRKKKFIKKRGKFSMEEKLLELIKLADTLNEKQDKVFAEIKYEADDSKTLRISIRKKDDYKYVEICEMQMREHSLIKWDNIIELFRKWLKDT